MAKIQLPDFDDLFALNEKISELSKEKLRTELEIKLGEANITKRAMTDEIFYVNGKPPSMEFIKNSYLYTGVNDELIPLREKFIDASSELDMLKIKLQLYRDLVDLYRTESANERAIL